MDLCGGLRCCTRMKAIPVSGGICTKNCSNASRPPAEAPIPTTGNGGLCPSGGGEFVEGEIRGFSKSPDWIGGSICSSVIIGKTPSSSDIYGRSACQYK